MSMAPTEIHEQYFSEVYDFIQAQARNKRLHLQMENEELALWLRKLEEDRKSSEQSGDDMKQPAVEQKNNDDEMDAGT